MSNCGQLEKVDCSDNLLVNIALPNNLTNLKYLSLNSNNLFQDLSFLTKRVKKSAFDILQESALIQFELEVKKLEANANSTTTSSKKSQVPNK